MDTEQKFELYVFAGDYGLPSLDIESLKSILYTSMAKVPVQLKVLSNIKNCSLYSAPCLVHGEQSFKSFNDIVTYLRSQNYTIDANLNAKQCSEIFAITTSLAYNLKPVIDFVYWLDQRNCDNFTSLWFMKALPLPFNYYYTRRFKNDATTLIEVVYPTESNMDIVKEFINSKAVQCLSDLSTRLGDSDYFYGAAPTTLDVIAYSHIAPLIQLPFPAKEIPNLFTMWPNLVKFVKRINAKYFSHLPASPKYLRKEENVPKSTDDDISYIAAFLFTLSAASLILSFAYSKGILVVKQ